MEESRARQIVNELRSEMFGGEQAAIAEGQQIHGELSDLNPNIEMDAKEFGEHVRNGGWRLGLLVARSVESLGRGRPSKSDNSEFAKIGANAFAHKSGASISDKTVTKYLDAWDAASVEAENGIPHSTALLPGQGFVFDNEKHTPDLWNKYFKPQPGGRDRNLLREVNSRFDTTNAIEPAEYRDRSLFEGRSDYSLKEVFDANERWVRAAVTKGAQIRENLIAVAGEMGYRISYEDES